ncbi:MULTISPECIES: NAD(P)H-binding protein [Mycobacteriaceae]|uniref:NAD(P)H-binding protein n=1 Tax=Mycobacteriaceae TaxID=1762 RepID=UPI0008008934|nr:MULTISPECIES: NAD(P)H-binding protein [Mycobacteriaceae]MCK0177423.1 NAD(P)H-binding protein [Mycolicibacterium sp. F2034L]OBB61504.1 NAD(P)-dependent oxidoreductase [Mycobacterium sp. 852013-51886_SCH5428379]
MTTDTTLVLGATGKTGRRVAARLRMRGIPVRAASRSSQTAFDWSQPSTWDSALDGVATVYAVAPATPGPMHDFTTRAEAAGVRHVVLLSGRGADTWGDSDFGRDMRDAEAAVRGSRLAWTVLRPNNFAQNFDEELWYEPLTDGELALPAGDVPEPFIDIEDVAAVAATVLADPGRHTGQTYELTGPRSITFTEAVTLISRASGKSMSYRQISPAEYRADSVARGLSDDTAHHLAEMFALMDRGLLSGTTDGVATVLGRPPRPFEEYVARTAATGVWSR